MWEPAARRRSKRLEYRLGDYPTEFRGIRQSLQANAGIHDHVLVNTFKFKESTYIKAYSNNVTESREPFSRMTPVPISLLVLYIHMPNDNGGTSVQDSTPSPPHPTVWTNKICLTGFRKICLSQASMMRNSRWLATVLRWDWWQTQENEMTVKGD